MTDIAVRLLSADNEIAEYERLLYDAYVRNEPDPWYMAQYDVIDGNRLRVRTVPARTSSKKCTRCSVLNLLRHVSSTEEKSA